MSPLSIDNALNILGIAERPTNPQALEEAYEAALKHYQSAKGPASVRVHELLQGALHALQNAATTVPKAHASDPEYAYRFDQALSWLSTTPLSFEILGACLWVRGSQGSSALFESPLRAHGFQWAFKKACWILRPKASIPTDLERQPWDLERIRSTDAYRVA